MEPLLDARSSPRARAQLHSTGVPERATDAAERGDRGRRIRGSRSQAAVQKQGSRGDIQDVEAT